MNNYNFGKIFLLISFLVICGFSAKSQPVIELIDAPEMKKAIEQESGAIVLDVRRPYEISTGKIPGAENIDINEDEFWLKFKVLNRDKTYYVYCETGGRGTSAARVMKQMGFKNVYNLRGGIEAWKSNGYLIE